MWIHEDTRFTRLVRHGAARGAWYSGSWRHNGPESSRRRAPPFVLNAERSASHVIRGLSRSFLCRTYKRCQCKIWAMAQRRVLDVGQHTGRTAVAYSAAE